MFNLAIYALSILPSVAGAVSVVNERDLPHCGARGYNQKTEPYKYTPNPELANYASCGHKCYVSSKCNSFALGLGACLLYNTTISSSVEHDKESPLVCYDKACASSQQKPPKSSPELRRKKRANRPDEKGKSKDPGNNSGKIKTPTAPVAVSSSIRITISSRPTSSSLPPTIPPTSSRSPSSSSSLSLSTPPSSSPPPSTTSSSVASATPSLCWNALGSNIPSPAPDNMIQNNLQAGYWNGWTTTPNGAEITDDCPGYNGEPSGKINLVNLQYEAELAYDGLAFQAGIQYELSMYVLFETSSSCRLRFYVPTSRYFQASVGFDPVTDIPTGTWTQITGSFIAKQGDQLQGFVACTGLATAHFSRIKLKPVSNTVYTGSTTPAGQNVITDSGFDLGLLNYLAQPYGASITTSPDNSGTSGSPNINVTFPAYDGAVGSLDFQIEISLKEEAQVPVVKGEVYMVSVDIRTDPNPAVMGCNVMMDVRFGSNLLATAFSTSLASTSAGYNHFAGPVPALAGMVDVFLTITCRTSLLPQTTFYIDNFSLTEVSA